MATYLVTCDHGNLIASASTLQQARNEAKIHANARDITVRIVRVLTNGKERFVEHVEPKIAKPSLKTLEAHCRPLGLTVRLRDGEYRLAWHVSREPSAERAEATAYYTDDAADVIGTANAMANERYAAVIDALHRDKRQA